MKILSLIAAAACSLFTVVNPAFAQGTAFTYQGHLVSGGSPASGSYDLQFTLYATNATGGVIAGPVTNSATAVSSGLFTATIDFGPGVFPGTSCWLDIAVRTNGAAAFTELTPRQPITPTPYAIFANTASNVSGTISAGQLNGPIPVAELPASMLTNGASGIALAGTFTGNGGGLTNLAAVTTNDYNALAPDFVVEIFGVTNYAQVNGAYTNAGNYIYRSVQGYTNYVCFDTNFGVIAVKDAATSTLFLAPASAIQSCINGRTMLQDQNSDLGALDGYMVIHPATNAIIPRALFAQGLDPSGAIVTSVSSNFPPISPMQTWVVGGSPVAAVINESGIGGRFRTYGGIPSGFATNGAYNCFRYEGIMLDTNNLPIGDRTVIFGGKMQILPGVPVSGGVWNQDSWANVEIQVAADANNQDADGAYANSMTWSGHSTVLVGALKDASDGTLSAALANARLEVRGQGTARPAFMLEPGNLCSTVWNGAVEYDGTNFFNTVQNTRIPEMFGQAGHTNGVNAATSLTVAFKYAMPTTNYVVSLIGNGAPITEPYFTAQTATGFTVSLSAFTGTLRWSAIMETQ